MNPLKILKLYRAVDRLTDRLEEAKMNKALWQSKTFWFNILTAGAQVANLIPLDPHITAVIVGCINIGLRFVTKEPVSLLGK